MGGVHLVVPEGWRGTSIEPAPGTVASAEWVAPGDGGSRLQVVVGCGEGGVDDLVAGVLGTPRLPLTLTDAREVQPAPEVAGLDAARRLELTFGLGRDDDATTLRTSGLYGHAGDALVLVELSAPARDHDAALADEVLGSVRTDPDLLAAGCD